MTSTQRKRLQKRRLPGQPAETIYDFVIGNTAVNTQNANEIDIVNKNVVFGCTNHLKIECSPQVKMETLKKGIFDRMRCEVENVFATIETRVHYSILSAMDNSILLIMELAMMSVDASSSNYLDSAVLDPDQGDFLEITNGLKQTASSRFNSSMDLNRTDETHDNINFEAGSLPVIERNFDQETHTHHRCILKFV